MTKKDTSASTQISEEDIIALLGSLKKEPTPEADFEERFLCDFHELIAREAVCTPARTRVWEHLVQLFTGSRHRKWAYGASTLSVGALALGFFAIPGADEETPGRTKATLQSSFQFLPASPNRSTRPYTSIQTIKSKQNSLYHTGPATWMQDETPSPTDTPVRLSSDPALYTSAATNDEDNFCKINYTFSH